MYGIDVAPDGSALVFTGAERGKRSVYLLDLWRRRVHRLTFSSMEEFHPSFSADGQRVLYSRWDPTDREGGYSRAMHVLELDLTTGSERQITDDPIRQDGWATSSPDGAWIVIDAGIPVHPLSSVTDLFLFCRADGTLRRWTFEEFNSLLRPRFWPDSRRVVFTALKNRETERGMYLAQIDREDPQARIAPVTPLGERAHSPYPLPDGRMLCLSDCGDYLDYKICAVDPTMGDREILAHPGPGSLSPVYCPATGDLYWTEGTIQLFRLHLPTGKKTRVGDRSLFMRPSRWR